MTFLVGPPKRCTTPALPHPRSITAASYRWVFSTESVDMREHFPCWSFDEVLCWPSVGGYEQQFSGQYQELYAGAYYHWQSQRGRLWLQIECRKVRMFSDTRFHTDNAQDHIEDLAFGAFHSLFGYIRYGQARSITMLPRLRKINVLSFWLTTIKITCIPAVSIPAS